LPRSLVVLFVAQKGAKVRGAAWVRWATMRYLVLSFLLLLGCGNAAPTSTVSLGSSGTGVPLAIADGAPGCRMTDGTTAAAGAVAPSTDGTNTCTCAAAGWSCTELAIHPRPPVPPSNPPPSAAPVSASGPARARYVTDGTCALTDGTVGSLGTSSPSDDGCNTCTCGPSGWGCTEMACPE
jgi:hypothetical protein